MLLLTEVTDACKKDYLFGASMGSENHITITLSQLFNRFQQNKDTLCL